MKIILSKKTFFVLVGLTCFGLLFQNCAKKLLSESATSIAEAELQNTYEVAQLDYININQDKTVYSSTSTVLSAYPFSEDSAEFKYQWKFKGKELPGQTAKELVLSNLDINQSGLYSVVIKTNVNKDQKLRNQEQEVLVANLVVEEKPLISTVVEITGQSQSMKIEKGTKAFLQIKHKAYPTASVQWYKDSVPIVGATSDHFIIEVVDGEDEGIYHAELSNFTGKIKSEEILVLVESAMAAPIVRDAAGAQDLALGQSINLFIDVLAVEDVTYSWYKDDQLLEGQISKRLQLRNSLNTDEGIYRVVARTASGSVEQNFTVTVFDQINIRTPLLNLPAVGVGKTATFTTDLSGDIESIEWFKNDVKIPGETSATLNISNVQIADEGKYKVVAKNRFGQVAQEAALTVVRPPQLLQPLAGETIYYTSQSDAGSILLLSSAVLGDSLQYQWYFKSNTATTFTEIAGAKSPIYSKTPLVEADSGDYKLIVSNISGSVQATAKIRAVSKISITKGLVSEVVPLSSTPYNIKIETSGNAEKFEWYKDGVLIPTATKNSFDFIPSVEAKFNFQVVVFDAMGTKVTSQAILNVPGKPIVTFGNISINVNYGGLISLNAGASGYEIKYQWYKDDVAIAGATSANFQKSNAQVTDSGVYKVVVSNISGQVSGAAQVVVKPPSAPVISLPLSNRLFFEGDTGSLSVHVTGTAPFIYKWYKDNVLIPTATSSSLTLTNVKVAQSGVYKVVVLNSVGEVTSSAQVTVNPPAAPKIISTEQHKTIFEGESASFSVSAQGTSPFSYKWYKDDVLIPTGTGPSLSLSNVKMAEAGKYKVVVSNSIGSATITSQLSVQATLMPAITNQSTLEPSYFEGDGFYLNIQATGGALTYKWFKNGTIISNNSYNYISRSNIKTTDSGLYRVDVSNSRGTVSTSFDVKIIPQILPQVTSHLKDSEIYLNGSIYLSPDVTGGGIKYRWFKDDILIYGATDSGYTVKMNGAADEGVYKVEMSNSQGTVFSSARIRIKPNVLPTVTLSSSSADSIYEKDPFSMSATANGGSLTYLWSKDGTPTGHTSTSFYLKDAAGVTRTAMLSDSGLYKITVTNSVGSASAQFALTVKAMIVPKCTIAPTTAKFSIGKHFSIYFNCEGGGLSYKWYKDGVLQTNVTRNYIDGNIDNILSTQYFTQDAVGTYRVDVSNQKGTTSYTTVVTANP